MELYSDLPANQPENIQLIRDIVTDLGFNHIVKTTTEIHDQKIAFSQLCHVIAALVDYGDDLSITG